MKESAAQEQTRQFADDWDLLPEARAELFGLIQEVFAVRVQDTAVAVGKVWNAIKEVVRPAYDSTVTTPEVCLGCNGAIDDHRAECVVEWYQDLIMVRLEAAKSRALGGEVEDGK